MSKIKILTSFHKESDLFVSEIVQPIQVGTDVNGVVSTKYLHDNTGEQISAKNRMYCELTAQYWAWKNLDADYYGFMHYRRYFSFSESNLKCDQYGNIIYPRITPETLKELGYTDNSIRHMVEPYDVLSVEPQDTRVMDGSADVYEHYQRSKYHRISDLDTVVQIIDEKYPEYSGPCKEYLHGHFGYFCNMYILKKEVFQDYCAWAFDILAEHERRTDLTDYDINEYRVSGFLAERLWGIYYTKIKQDGRLKCKELQKSYFIDTKPAPDIQPAFKQNNIPIVMAADDGYVPYVTVMIRSVAENANPNKNYDFVILHSSITSKHQRQIQEEFREKPNFSIRFCDVAYLYAGVNLKTHFHISVETFYRLLMQDIMKHYDKVLYMDSDLVVLDDLAKLYDTDMTGYCLGAVRDIDMAGNYHGKDPNRKAYFQETLTIANPYDYINAGVLVMNLAEFRRNFTTQKILDTIAMHEWLYMDQDILNYLCDGRILFMDMAWNVVMNWQNETGSRIEVAINAPHQLYLDYMESRKHPKVAHYAGFQKPWALPECDMADYFWKYAEMTGVYQELKKGLVPSTQALPSAVSVNAADPYQLRVNGLDESIYIDGLYIKLINKLNTWFPKESKKRERLKRFMRLFFH